MRAPRGLTRFLVGLLAVSISVSGLSGLAPTLADGRDDGGPDDISRPAESAAEAPETEPPEREDLPSYLEHYSHGFRIDTREFTFTQRYFWHRLFRPNKRDRFEGACLFVAATGLAFEKRDISEDVEERNTPGRTKFFKGVQTLGGQGVVPGIALLFYVGGSTFGSYRTKQTGYMMAESALLT